MSKTSQILNIFTNTMLLFILAFPHFSAGVSVKAAGLSTDHQDASITYTAIAAGAGHTCALTSAGGVRCWGFNEAGQLGNGTTTVSNIPVDVSGLGSGVSAIAAGGAHTCVLTASGGVQCWGQNGDGQLGNGMNVDSPIPVNVSGLSSGVSAIAAGDQHTCALTVAGDIKCWGNNQYGSLGDGTNADSNTPLNVSGLAGSFIAVSAGGSRTCALTTGGGASCWGSAWMGNSLPGDVSSNTPVSVVGLPEGIGPIVPGYRHICVLTGSGGTRCWGQDDYGQLGEGTNIDNNIPVEVSGLSSGVNSITVGWAHTCALTGGGVKCWGWNNYGQLGDGTNTDRNSPVDVSTLTGAVSAITTGLYHTCALIGGSARCWGFNGGGQLGNGTFTNSNIPVDVVTLNRPGTFNKIAPTNGSTSKSSPILTWVNSEGASSYEYCYDNTDDNICTNWVPNGAATSLALSGLSPDATFFWQVRSINDAGITYANDSDSAFWSFTTDDSAPVVSSSTRAGPTFTSAASVDFSVTFSKPVTGVNADDFILTNTGITGATVTGLSGSDVSYNITVNTGTGTGTLHLDVIDDDSIQDGAGNLLGGPGAGNGNYSAGEIYAIRQTGEYIDISAGRKHTCGLTSSGGVRCWGSDEYDSIGDGLRMSTTTPVNTSGLTSGVKAISTGNYHTCALLNTGKVKCWGKNQYGQLGDGTTVQSGIPVDVVGLAGIVTAISAGGEHTCALSSGAAWCWGRNFVGQLGNGTKTDSQRPVRVSGLGTQVSAIETGWDHTCALVSGGIKCWGSNGFGELGDGTGSDRTIPVAVNGLNSGVIALAAGVGHTCAVTMDGGAKCWGANFSGALGNGTTITSFTPQPVVGLAAGVKAITAGLNHTCAIYITGGATCWGDNYGGQLGNGTNTKSLTPVDVVNLASGVSDITTRLDHTCALISGVARCWGFNFDGGLGDGTKTASNIPVDVFNKQLPGAFKKISPANGSTSRKDVVLRWEASSGATEYEYCYTKFEPIYCSEWISNGAATSVTLSGLDEYYPYYWQVRAKNPGVTYSNGSYQAQWLVHLDEFPPELDFLYPIVLTDSNPSSLARVRFTVNFTEPVTGVTAADFSLTTSGITGAKIMGVAGSGKTYIVTVSTGKGIGTIRLNVLDYDRIRDIVGLPFAGKGNGNGNFFDGPKYSICRNNQFFSAAAADGWVLETSETSGLGGSYNTTAKLVVGDDAGNRQYRSLLNFNLAGRLPAKATIVKITLKIKEAYIVGSDPFKTHGYLTADLRKGFFGPSANLELIDFHATATWSQIGGFLPVVGQPGWYQMVIHPAYFRHINLAGPTQFRLRFTRDDNNDMSADLASFYSGEAAVNLRPIMIVDYTLP